MHRRRAQYSRRKPVILAVLAVLTTFLTTMCFSSTAPCRARSSTATWRYSQFVQAVQQGQIASVKISADRAVLSARTQNYEKIYVPLPEDPQLGSLLAQHQVEVRIVAAVVAPYHNPVLSQNSFIDLINLLVILGVALLSFTVWFWALLECATTEISGSRTKIVWMLVIILMHSIGALLYLVVRRSQRIRKLGR